MNIRDAYYDLQEQQKAEFLARVRERAQLKYAHLPRKARRRRVKEAVERAMKRGDYL